jgi:hypothetical protein
MLEWHHSRCYMLRVALMKVYSVVGWLSDALRSVDEDA